METRPLGKSGMHLPVVGMGTWKTFDVEGAKRNARRRLVTEAIDLGVRLFDTSPMYGAAEEILGEALQNRRDHAFVATKVWAATREEGVRQVRHAMNLYGGHVEIYQIHNLRMWQEHLPELERRKEIGEVSVIGATHYNPNAFFEVEDAIRSGRFDMVQVPYNLIERSVEKKLLALCEKQGVGVLVMEPLGTGVLPRKEPAPDRLAPFLDEHVTTWAQVCLKWILSDARVTSILPATTDPGHLRENAAVGRGAWYDAKERAAIVDLLN